MSGPTWTPAPKRGVVPLHPFTFGTLLGRAFAILRHNPKVIFGFAVVVQLLVAVVTAAVMVGVLLLTIGRLETVSSSSPDFEPLLLGTLAINGLVAFALGLLSIGFTAVLQGVVAAEVRFAAIGSKATLGMLWRQMRPAFWRLVGWSLLQMLYIVALIVIAFALIVGATLIGGDSALAAGIIVAVLLVLGAIPLSVWLWTKLLLVPSILVFEHARLRTSLVRSWRLTRRRFWVAFGVMALIGLIMGLAAQVIATPFSIISGIFIPVIAPTGAQDPAAILSGLLLAGLLPQVLVLIVQAVSAVVQSTGAAFIYLDCRFRYEGLDQTLLAHVERQQLGASAAQLDDPFAVDPARAVTSTPPPRPVPGPQPYPGAGYQPYPGPGYQPYPGAGYQPYPGAGDQPYAGRPQPGPGAVPPFGHAYPAQPFGGEGRPDMRPPSHAAPPYAAPSAAASAPASAPDDRPAAPEPPAPEETGWTAPGSDT